jgi:hypothetical protein
VVGPPWRHVSSGPGFAGNGGARSPWLGAVMSQVLRINLADNSCATKSPVFNPRALDVGEHYVEDTQMIRLLC